MAVNPQANSGGLHGIGEAFSWGAIGLAVLTAIFQGLVTALAFMTESSSRWTFRFRLALVEHLWWTFVSVLLLCSLVMSAIAFTSGQGGDPVSVLALSSATFLAVVQYSVPAWQHRRYTLVRWYAWSGDSRTAIKSEYSKFCGDAAAWARLVSACSKRLARLQPTPSDYYGWRLWSMSGIKEDPTDVFRVLNSQDVRVVDSEKASPPVGVYAMVDANPATVSLRWGREQNFLRRVSRAVASMPLCLMRSSPTTADGYDGRGLATAMGILGRNKGLQPWKLVFKSTAAITADMENASTWSPRPAKVLRSFYKQAMHVQYQGLGEDFVSAAVELALLMADIPSWAIVEWLKLGLEHQSLVANRFLADVVEDDERAATLSAHYESSYVSMTVSLNAMQERIEGQAAAVDINRPDLLCTCLLMKARNLEEPSWWKRPDVQELISGEVLSLNNTIDWKTSMAKLLGLSYWPESFGRSPRLWTTPVT